MEFKEKLKKLRTDNGLSQEALADAVHISRSAIAKYENGNGNPSEETLKALAVYFGVEVDELRSDQTVRKNKNNKTLIKAGTIAFAILLVGGTITGVTLGIINYKKQNSSPYPPDLDIKNANVSLTYYYYNNGIAKLYYENQTLGSAFKDIVEPNILVAGDVLNFQYTGRIMDPIFSIPGELDVAGNLEKYKYIQTVIQEFTFSSVSELDGAFKINDRYVITNKSGQYISLDDFSGNKLYLSFDYKSMYMDERGDISHDPERKIISGIYSFNPR